MNMVHWQDVIASPDGAHMYRNSLSFFILMAMTMSLAACSSYNQDWPSLNAPLPKEEDRVRVTADPSGERPNAPESEEVISIENATILISEAVTARDMARLSYDKAVQAFIDADEDEKRDFWNGAQLALTRLSQSLAPLDDLIFSTNTELNQYKMEAQGLADKLDEYVVAERRNLARKVPNN